MAKILIADDEPQVREMVEQTLEELADQGVELIAAGNGMEALEAIRQHRPDLVFLDTLMPKMNGHEVAKVARSEFGLQETQIVMLSSKGQEHQEPPISEVGPQRTLTKPLDPDEVYDVAVSLLRR
ncbi:MAG: response regulator [Syntrophobacteraceae bacterium]|nr:response regulator [Syntrophobacteraceae bacterium]